MDKRTRRTQSKIENIKQSALELFAMYGADKVNMDEIAAKANVSKVTIYKYFGSKENLYAEVINLFVEDTLTTTENILNSDMEFLEKLKFVVQLQIDSVQLVNSNYLFQLWDQNNQLAKHMNERLQSKVKSLMFKFYEEGRRKGYINENVSFDILYLYAEIFRAGIRATAIDMESTLVDKDALEALYNLYFFGFVNQKMLDEGTNRS